MNEVNELNNNNKLSQKILILANRLKIPSLKGIVYCNDNKYLEIQNIVWKINPNGDFESDPIIFLSPEQLISFISEVSHLFRFLRLSFKWTDQNQVRIFLFKSSVKLLIESENKENLDYSIFLSSIEYLDQKGKIESDHYLQVHTHYQLVWNSNSISISPAELYLSLKKTGEIYDRLSLTLATPNVMGAENTASNALSNNYLFNSFFLPLSSLEIGDTYLLGGNYLEDRKHIADSLKKIADNQPTFINFQAVKRTQGNEKRRLFFYKVLCEISSLKIYQDFSQFFAFLRLAKDCLAHESWEKAILEYEKAIKLLSPYSNLKNSKPYPEELASCYMGLAIAYRKLKKYSEAKKNCRFVIRLNPDISSHLLMARIACEKNELETSEQMVEELLLKLPNNWEIYELWGTVAAQKGQYQKSKERYTKAIQLAETDLNSSTKDRCKLYYFLAMTLSHSNEHSEAMKFYAKALYFFIPEESRDYLWLAYSLFNLNQKDREEWISKEYNIEDTYYKTIAYAAQNQETLNETLEIMQALGEKASDFYFDLIEDLREHLLYTLSESELPIKLEKIKHSACQPVIDKIVFFCKKIVEKNLLISEEAYETVIDLLSRIESEFLTPGSISGFCIKGINESPNVFLKLLQSKFSSQFYFKLGENFEKSNNKESAFLCYKAAFEAVDFSQNPKKQNIFNKLFFLSLHLNCIEEINLLLNTAFPAIETTQFYKQLISILPEKIIGNSIEVDFSSTLLITLAKKFSQLKHKKQMIDFYLKIFNNPSALISVDWVMHHLDLSHFVAQGILKEEFSVNGNHLNLLIKLGQALEDTEMAKQIFEKASQIYHSLSQENLKKLPLDVHTFFVSRLFKSGAHKQGLLLCQKCSLDIPQDEKINPYRNLLQSLVKENNPLYQDTLSRLADLLEEKIDEPSEFVFNFCWVALQGINPNHKIMQEVINLMPDLKLIDEMVWNLKPEKGEMLLLEAVKKIDSEACAAWMEKWNNSGMTLFKEEKYEDAAKCFQIAVTLSSEQPPILYNQAVTLFKLNKRIEAKECLMKALFGLQNKPKSELKEYCAHIINPLMNSEAEINKVWEEGDKEDRLYELIKGFLQKHYPQNNMQFPFWNKNRYDSNEVENFENKKGRSFFDL